MVEFNLFVGFDHFVWGGAACILRQLALVKKRDFFFTTDPFDPKHIFIQIYTAAIPVMVMAMLKPVKNGKCGITWIYTFVRCPDRTRSPHHYSPTR